MIFKRPPSREKPPSREEMEFSQQIREYSGQYKQRVCCTLSEEHFLSNTQQYLQDRDVVYVCVPYKWRREVYYFFKDLRGVRILLQALDEVAKIQRRTDP